MTAPAEKTTPPAPSLARDARRRRQNRLFAATCVTSLAVHLGAVAAYAFWPVETKPAIDLDKALVKAKLVKLGKPRDEKLLPRLPTQAPPPPSDRAKPALDKPMPEKPAEPSTVKPTAAEILSQFQKTNTQPPDVNELIRERIGEPTDEGQQQGDAAGTELSGSLQAQYLDRLFAHIRAATEISTTLTDDERVRLKASLFLRVSEEGLVLEAKIAESSGSTVYDADVIAAAKRASPVPAPPIPLRALFDSGVVVNFCPVRCS